MLAGWAADRALGDPRRGHPVALFGTAMTALEGRIWRDDRRAGVAYAAAGAALGAGPVLLADRALRDRPAARAALTGAVTWAALGGRYLAAAGRDLGARVAAGDLDGARALAPTLVGRDPRTLDAAGLSRAGLESVAENTSDAVVAPFVWGAVLGAPGVALHRALNTMDAMVGHRSPRHERFGWAAARADDVGGWPAARTAAALTVLAAPAVGGSAAGALRTWLRDGARHPSPNAGRVEAAFAGALGVRLGGRNVYGERVEERPVLGGGPDGTAGRPPTPADLERAARLSLWVGGLAAVGAASVAATRPSRG
nr:CobD/CbiB family cobalamin biosynthesis protein [Patulibacter sp. SYSU D01012]